MSLFNYIRGNRKGKEAHRLEKDAMTDPFLADALEGFDTVDDDHMARLAALQKKLGDRSSQKSLHRKQSIWTSIAAVAVVLILIVGISHIGNSAGDNGLHAQSTNMVPISIYIPEAVYTENIAVIATKNTELTRNLSVQLGQYKPVAEDIAYESLEEELLALETGLNKEASLSHKEDLEAIQIYIPTAIGASQRRHNQAPEPLMGMDDYKQYLKKEIRRPSVWPCEGKTGTVLVEFSVDDEGNPYDVVAEYGICGASDDEAVRLVKDGPKWTPSNVRGKVRVTF